MRIIDPHPEFQIQEVWSGSGALWPKFSGDEDAAPFENPCTVAQLLLSQAYHL